MASPALQVSHLTQQQWLFDIGLPEPEHLTADREFKRAIDAVLKARREIQSYGQERGMVQINACLEALRSISRLTPTQREELVLWAIERSGAVTITEIAEDSRLGVVIVKQIVESLGSQGILYKARRYIPGSDRPYWMIKSRRVKTPEVV